MKAVNVTVTTSPTLMFAPDDKNRWVRIHNKSGGAIYVGHDTVSVAQGFEVDNGENIELFIPTNETLWGITNGGTSTIMTLTPDVD